jgi:hypothetical protein
MATQNYFRSISILREAMLSDNKLRVIHYHKVWTSSFVWADPVPEKLVEDVKRRVGKKFPEDFFVFLTLISNGAILYRNAVDAMTGYKIFSIDEFLEKQAHWQESLKGLWLSNFIAIGEIISENRPLVMDLDSPTKDGQSCKLLEGNAYDPVSHWLKLSQSFHEWIDQLITAQGAQYWLWR